MAKFDETANILLQSLLSKQRVVVSFNSAPTTLFDHQPEPRFRLCHENNYRLHKYFSDSTMK